MSEESEYSEDGEGTWVEWFCSLEDHFWFCEIDHDFIKDPLNHYGIKAHFPNFNQAIQMLLQLEGPQQNHLQDQTFLELYQEAVDVYGLLHAKFILTPKGLSLMRQKYLQGQFGQCPRVLCENHNVLPIGVSEEFKTARVKVFCPRCEDVYNYQPKKKCLQIDGAYFGGSFPHILLMSFYDLKPTSKDCLYSPQIFGFKIQGKQGSRMTLSLPTDTTNPLEPKILSSIQPPKNKKNKKGS